MDQKLQKWSLIAEIVGGIGVLITLLILVIELKTNSELTRTIAFQQEIGNLNEWRRNIASDPNQARIFTSYTRGEELPDNGTEDYFILQLIVTDQYTNYESAYLSRKSGILGDSEWQRVMRSACAAYRGTLRHEGFWDMVSFRITDEFANYIELSCDE